jgi:hypothetical protein
MNICIAISLENLFFFASILYYLAYKLRIFLKIYTLVFHMFDALGQALIYTHFLIKIDYIVSM